MVVFLLVSWLICIYTFSHTLALTMVSTAHELLHCSLVHVLPLQIWLLDNLSQLQYKGKWLTSIIYISQPLSLSLLVIPGEEICTRAQCPRRPCLNWLNSLSQDPCTSESSHGEDTCNKQLLHIPDGRARQMSKENQRERQGKVYEPAFANLNEKLSSPTQRQGAAGGTRGLGSPSQNTTTTQRVDSLSCLFSALWLKCSHSGTSTSTSGLNRVRNLYYKTSVHSLTTCVWEFLIFFFPLKWSQRTFDWTLTRSCFSPYKLGFCIEYWNKKGNYHFCISPTFVSSNAECTKTANVH